MKHVILIVASVILGASVLALGFTYLQVQQERFALSADLEYRARLLAESLNESIEPAYATYATSTLSKLATSFANRERLVGVAIFERTGATIVSSEGMPSGIERSMKVMDQAIETNEPVGDYFDISGRMYYVHARPLHRGADGSGVFVVVQDAAYIAESVQGKWKENLVGVLVYLLLFAAAIAALVRWVIFMPLSNLAESIKSARSGKSAYVPESKHDFFFRPLATEIGKLAQSLTQARTAASEEARMRLEKIDTPWTAERLKAFIKSYLKDRPIYVVSNAEPFVHSRVGRKILHSVPAGGVVTAISSVMEACGGMWLAHGSGDADRETADGSGKIAIPPDEPRYTLKRVWLTDEEVKGYCQGFSNEALWPLCHIAHTRPIFRKEDWAMYRKVNGKFAETLLAELKGVERPIILIQDYHFALLPRMIKMSRPDAQVALFWHIPWPSAEAFSICPWRKEIVGGMLGADVIGFHTQLFCNNFLNTVGKEIESLMDFEQCAVTREGHTSYVRSFPISIALTSSGPENNQHTDPDRTTLERLGIRSKYLILGVDRMDYTKGLLERLTGISFFLAAHPEYSGDITFLLIASPTREGVDKYREYAEQVAREVEHINKRFGSNGWRPIVLEKKLYSRGQLLPLYQLADVCLVTSLHDGMNLVAKEFVAARPDESGALILSQFAGASRDLKGAIIINPYSAEETEAAIFKGLTMPRAEQRRRMKTMRSAVKNYNVYRWSAELIKAVADLG